LVLDWCSWIFQADGPGYQIATSRHCSHLEANFVSSGYSDVALNIRHGKRQKEAFTPVLIADTPMGLTSGFRVDAGLSCDSSDDPFFTEHNFGCDFGDCAGNGLAGAPVIGHFEFDRVTYFQMLNVSIKLGEMEEKSSLAIAALNKSI
jgi:hypothetical protein